MKRAVSLFLAIIILLSIVPFSAFSANTKASTYEVGDVIEFGSYPQMEVTNNAVIKPLNALSITWKSFNYYSGDGDGEFFSGDWMKYADVTYSGHKYRAVKFTKYRPTSTGFEALDYGYEDDNYYTEQDRNGYYTDTVYWFLYEPLEWVLLDPDTGLVQCKTVIDNQPFSNTIYDNSTPYMTAAERESVKHFKDKAHTISANDYYNSDIRKWLNDDFYNTAFSSDEKNKINYSNVITLSQGIDESSCEESKDKVFLLNMQEELRKSYGFSQYANDPNKRKPVSDYAKAQGVSMDNNTSFFYWLRSPSRNGEAQTFCSYKGITGIYVDSLCGVCPAIHLDGLSFNSGTFYIGNIYDGEFFVESKATSVDSLAPSFDVNWFENDSSLYNQYIARFCSVAALEGYQAKGKANSYPESDIWYFLQSYGFATDSKYIKLNTGRNQENYFIGVIKIRKNYNLVFMGLIGSQGQQWNSNFDPQGKESSTYYADDTYDVNHYGFNDAKNYAYSALRGFFNDNGLKRSNTKLLLTGHSRGAAAANLLAADLINKDGMVKPENIFTYTFATPNNTKDKHRTDSKYKRIFNIVYPTDFVTHVLLESWGYGKYGTTYKLPTGSNDFDYKYYKNRMLNYYKSINPVTVDGKKKDKDKQKVFYDYGDESRVKKVVKVMGKYVKNFDQYYNKKYTLVGLPLIYPLNLIPVKRLTPFEYFQQGLCPQVNKTKDKNEKDYSLALMATPLADDFISGGGSNLYKHLSGFFIVNQAISPNFEDAHKMETYCSFMLALSKTEVTQKRKTYTVLYNCPVDIEVVDKSTSQTVAKIKDNKVDSTVAGKENALYAEVEGDEKSVWLPSNGNYDIKITGNDNGKFDYSVENTDAEEGETVRTNYFDVNVAKNEQYSSTLNAGSVNLKNKNGSTVTASEVLSTESKYDINISTDGRGEATESMSVTSGEYVTLTAAPKCSDFAGWYENGTLISEDIEYRFRPTRSMNIVAEFENERAHTYKNTVNKATMSANGTIKKVCSVCGEGSMTSIAKIHSVALTTAKYTYGSVRTPGVVVKDSKGKTLKKNTDYTVTYPGGRKNVGSYTVKVVFKGNYSGSKNLTFKIFPKATSLSKLSSAKKAFGVSWKRQLTQTTGYQIQYSLKSNFSGAKTKTINNYKAYKYVVKGLASKRVYYVRIRTYKRAAGVNYYSSWSKAKSVRIR